jgi:hypothetical protein
LINHLKIKRSMAWRSLAWFYHLPVKYGLPRHVRWDVRVNQVKGVFSRVKC